MSRSFCFSSCGKERNFEANFNMFKEPHTSFWFQRQKPIFTWMDSLMKNSLDCMQNRGHNVPSQFWLIILGRIGGEERVPSSKFSTQLVRGSQHLWYFWMRQHPLVKLTFLNDHKWIYFYHWGLHAPTGCWILALTSSFAPFKMRHCMISAWLKVLWCHVSRSFGAVPRCPCRVARGPCGAPQSPLAPYLEVLQKFLHLLTHASTCLCT